MPNIQQQKQQITRHAKNCKAGPIHQAGKKAKETASEETRCSVYRQISEEAILDMFKTKGNHD